MHGVGRSLEIKLVLEVVLSGHGLRELVIPTDVDGVGLLSHLD